VSWDYGRLVAEVYELDKPVGSSFPGLRYYTRQLAGVTGRILEPATGTGRVLVPLLEAGFAAEGLDVSPDMLAAFRESLSPGGRLILDVGAPELITGPAAMRYWERDPYLWTLQDMRTVYDPVANQTTSFLRYEKWRDGGLIATELQRFRLQYWSLTEFERLLADAGFTDINVTADYRDDHRPRPDSRVWTFHAIRPR
jgi:SAM-dependent methyltransferase